MMEAHNPITAPSHYTQYPVQPIEITRHLGFLLGNAVKYVLRAPYKGGVEDCDKALQYLDWEAQTPGAALSWLTTEIVRDHIETLCDCLAQIEPDGPEQADILQLQAQFLMNLDDLLASTTATFREGARKSMCIDIKRLRAVLVAALVAA